MALTIPGKFFPYSLPSTHIECQPCQTKANETILVVTTNNLAGDNDNAVLMTLEPLADSKSNEK